MTISEVSNISGLTQDTLRYYEKLGLVPPVKRKPSGIRDYDDEDCRWIEFIKCMRGAGLPIDVLTRYVALFQEGEHTKQERLMILLEQRRDLIEKQKVIEETLKRLDRKIERYEDTVLEAENELKKI